MIAGNDNIPDVAMGRFSVWTEAQLLTVIDKLFSYERYPDCENWSVEGALLVSYYEGFPPYHDWYHECKNDSIIIPILQEQDFLCYDYWGEGYQNQDIIDLLNNSHIGSNLNYRGHGYCTSWPNWNNSENFTNDDIRALTNFDELRVVFEICCNCGRIGLPYDPPDKDTTCHSECWFRHADGGAVTALGATRPSPTYQNHKFDTELYRTAFGQGPVRPVTAKVGWMMNKAKIKTANQYGWTQEDMLWLIHIYHLVGDPEVEIITDARQSGALNFLNATHATRTGDNPQVFTVNVKDGSAMPVFNALVCLYQAGILQEIGYTDINGDVGIGIDPMGGTLHVTVTKHNHRPYEGTCTVMPMFDGPQANEKDALVIESVLYDPGLRTLKIHYILNNPSHVTISVYDPAGRIVETVENTAQNKGEYQLLWGCMDSHGRRINNGVYFIRCQTDGIESTRKIVVF